MQFKCEKCGYSVCETPGCPECKTLTMKPVCEHNFQIARKDYYKPDGGENILGITYDQTKTFSTLFCTKCGKTKEISTN